MGPLPRLPLALVNPKRLAGALNWYRKRQHVHRPETFAALLADVQAQAPDHIAVTGDLTNLGLPAEIARAADWLGRIGAPSDVSVIPGNHDIYATVAGRRLGIAALAPWAAYFAACGRGRAWTGPLPFPFVRVLEKGGVRVALIGLNTAVETPPLVARGALGAKQLNALADVLAATRAAGLARVVMLHHPPLPGLTSSSHALADAAALTELLRDGGAELVMHGHTHRRMLNRIDGAHGPIPVVGVPSASAGRSHHGEPLSRAHLFEFRASAIAGRPTITLVARGLTAPGSAIQQIERVVL